MKTNMVYEWAPSFMAGDAAAQLVGERLEALRADNEGILVPRDVVADARRDDSPLHPLFEWNDRKAATEHRLSQARKLIRAIVVLANTDEDARPTRAYVADEELGGFRANAATTQLATMRAALAPVRATAPDAVEEARRELLRWRDRYGELEPFAELVDAINVALAERPEFAAHLM